MSPLIYEDETVLAAPLAQVFEFFSQADNLQRLTPPQLRFEILTPLPITMREGTIIDYRLRLYGVPFRWRTEITAWEPGRRFADSQRRGPYVVWEHTHSFSSVGPDSTLMRDRVRYLAPGGPFAPIVHALFVDAQVRRIFAFRRRAIAEVFPG